MEAWFIFSKLYSCRKKMLVLQCYRGSEFMISDLKCAHWSFTASKERWHGMAGKLVELEQGRSRAI